MITPLAEVISDDRDLLSPAHPVAADSAIYVMDGHRLLAFSYAGLVRWRLGRAGSGPGEYRLVTSQALDVGTGRLWQFDLGNGRVQILSSAGELLEVLQARRTLFKVAPLTDGNFVAALGGGSSFLHVFSETSGEELRAIPPPVPEYRDPQFAFSASAKIVTCPSGQVAVAYAYSSYLILLSRDLAKVLVRHAIDPVMTPRAVEVRFREDGKTLTGHRRAPDARQATLSIACDSERLLVLYEGSAAEPGRMIDVYRLADLGYVGSFRLPQAVRQISLFRDRLVGLRLDPVPALFAWRIRWP